MEKLVVQIRRAENGLILEVTEGEGDSVEVVYEERHEDDVEGFANFLRFLNERFGPSTSRYSEKRIYVRVEPGDKCESRPGTSQD